MNSIIIYENGAACDCEAAIEWQQTQADGEDFTLFGLCDGGHTRNLTIRLDETLSPFALTPAIVDNGGEDEDWL